MLDTYMGMQIIVSEYLVDTIEDWSDCRSPSRAKRRRKRGFAQRVRTVQVPKKDAFIMDSKIMMHPEIYKEFKRKMDNDGSYFKTKEEIEIEKNRKNFDIFREIYPKWNSMFLLRKTNGIISESMRT